MAESQTNFEVTIEKLVYGGEGLARLNGRVVLAPFVLPGERAAVETIAEKPGLLRTRLIEVRESAPERVIDSRPGRGPRPAAAISWADLTEEKIAAIPLLAAQRAAAR